MLLAAFNLNLDLIAPECAIPNVGYADKWAFIELLPLMALVVFVSIYIAKLVYKLGFTTKRSAQVRSVDYCHDWPYTI